MVLCLLFGCCRYSEDDCESVSLFSSSSPADYNQCFSSLDSHCWFYRTFSSGLTLSQPLGFIEFNTILLCHIFRVLHNINTTISWMECWIIQFDSLASRYYLLFVNTYKSKQEQVLNENNFIWLLISSLHPSISAGGQFSVVVIIQGMEGVVTVLGQVLYFLDVASLENLKW